MLKNFTYTKADKTTTERVVHVISPISDSMLALDLTEYTKEHRDLICVELDALHREYLDGITELGLSKHWRRFKQEGISDG